MIQKEKNLKLVTASAHSIVPIARAVQALESVGGNLDKFVAKYTPIDKEQFLYSIEYELAQTQNIAYKKRWQEALKLSAKVRMDLLRHKALKVLETYENLSTSSSAPDISYCKAILAGGLMSDIYREDNIMRQEGDREGDASRLDNAYREVEEDLDKDESDG